MKVDKSVGDKLGELDWIHAVYYFGLHCWIQEDCRLHNISLAVRWALEILCRLQVHLLLVAKEVVDLFEDLLRNWVEQSKGIHRQRVVLAEEEKVESPRMSMTAEQILFVYV